MEGADWVIPPLGFLELGCKQPKTNLHIEFSEHSADTSLFPANQSSL